MLKFPSTYFKAQQEIDEVIGKGKITVDHLKHLHYVEAILRETLRLEPTAPVIVRGLRDDSKEHNPSLGSGKYALKADAEMMCLLGKIQRDPAVYGENANEFVPERMLDEHFEKLPKHAWKVSYCNS
jgi:cytochrome P450/NADPH-cytochrome P450 reductase